ncbi:hypothetical protein [Singulisphaera sp. PoT]|uniref:hypothetical protein n=1 Tax=Singulisphaera sp. PoT TaxID=3411797 RepID=UPI003BF5FF05
MKTKPSLEVLEGRGLLSTMAPALTGATLFGNTDQLATYGRSAVRQSQDSQFFVGPRNFGLAGGGHLLAKLTVKQLIAESAATGQPSSTTLTIGNPVAISYGATPTVIGITFTPGDVASTSGKNPSLTVSYESGPSYPYVGRSVTYTYSAPHASGPVPSPVIHIGKTFS